MPTPNKKCGVFLRIKIFFSVNTFVTKISRTELRFLTYNAIGSRSVFKRGKVMNVKRGELYYADLSPVVGSEQGGIRPVLVVQNDVGNKYSPTIIAAAVTSKINKAKLPTHIELPSAYGLAKDSVILLEQIRTLDKRRLKERIGELPPATMVRVNRAILISLGFPVNNENV